MKASRLACAAVATVALITGAATPAQAAWQIVDSFENPPAPANSFSSYSFGSSIGPWQVTKGSVDVVRENYWEAGHSWQSVDLSGSSAGAITRVYPNLIPHLTYKLTFQITGNPECPVGWRTGDVWIDGKKATWFKINTAGITKDDMDYSYRQVTFKAKWYQSKVTFNSTTPGYCGPVLDNVRLTRGFFH